MFSIKIPRNDGTNLADYLLDGVNVRAIAVDGPIGNGWEQIIRACI